MPVIDRDNSSLLVVDFQSRLMPAIEEGQIAIGNARRLLAAAGILGVPVICTEQNTAGLGPTVPELNNAAHGLILHKMTFDACKATDAARLDERETIVVVGCEAHVCVLQTVLGLLGKGRRVYVVQDAVGSRRAESKSVAIRRMEQHGAEVVTTEMVLFEWLVTFDHPRFREVIALLK